MILEGLEAVAVCAYVRVPAFCKEVTCFLLGRLAVVAGDGSYVHLELNSHVMESSICGFVKVSVSFRMCQEGAEARCKDVLKHGLEARRRVPCGCLDEDGVVIHHEEVAGLEAFSEEVVEHVLRREVEGDAAGVCRLEVGETLTQGVSGVCDVFHYVRRAPYVCDAKGFFIRKHCEGVVQGADAVIHSWKDVGMTVGAALEDFGVLKGALWEYEI